MIIIAESKQEYEQLIAFSKELHDSYFPISDSFSRLYEQLTHLNNFSCEYHGCYTEKEIKELRNKFYYVKWRDEYDWTKPCTCEKCEATRGLSFDI